MLQEPELLTDRLPGVAVTPEMRRRVEAASQRFKRGSKGNAGDMGKVIRQALYFFFAQEDQKLNDNTSQIACSHPKHTEN